MMDLNYYLVRQKINLSQFVEMNNVKCYDDLKVLCKKRKLILPEESELKYEFKKVVEERPAAESSVKKKRVSNKKSSKPKTNDSSSSRRSRSAQRARKSSNKPQRKSDGGKVESVQPASGSEDTK